MSLYCDTGILLKLYIYEPASQQVSDWIQTQKTPITITSLHLSELTSALRLKQFRKECTAKVAEVSLKQIESDLALGILQQLAVDWAESWQRCRELSEKYAAQTGCRTLDVLHVACAQTLNATRFASSDKRQLKLAKLTGLKITNPTSG